MIRPVCRPEEVMRWRGKLCAQTVGCRWTSGRGCVYGTEKEFYRNNFNGYTKKPSKTNLQIVSVVGLMPRRPAKIKMQDPTCNNYDSYEVIAEF